MGGTFEVKIFMVCGAEHFYFILSRDIKGKPEQILEETQYSKNKRILKSTPNHFGNPWHAGDVEDNAKNKRREASLEARWQRILLPRQEARVRSSIQEDPHAAIHQLSPFATTTEPVLWGL